MRQTIPAPDRAWGIDDHVVHVKAMTAAGACGIVEAQEVAQLSLTGCGTSRIPSCEMPPATPGTIEWPGRTVGWSDFEDGCFLRSESKVNMRVSGTWPRERLMFPATTTRDHRRDRPWRPVRWPVRHGSSTAAKGRGRPRCARADIARAATRFLVVDSTTRAGRDREVSVSPLWSQRGRVWLSPRAHPRAALPASRC